MITHPKVFKQPTPLLLALEFVESLRGLEGVKILAPSERHWAIFASLCRTSDARGNLFPDAYHAALAIETGCLDNGFARLQGLRVVHPL